MINKNCYNILVISLLILLSCVFLDPEAQELLERRQIKKLIEQLLIIEIIGLGNSLAPANFIHKIHGSLRMVIIYRKLNKVIKRTLAHLPSITSMAWSMKDKEPLSSIDLKHGFYSAFRG